MNKIFITLILFSYIFHNNIVNAARATFCDLVDSSKEDYFTYYTSACNKKETIDKINNICCKNRKTVCQCAENNFNGGCRNAVKGVFFC
ncbi:hypothetical protein Mgra_00010238 [Meloidogyne graminicola]|uniref:Uncharacterized protein n=1 Tax=Meloidogyne graminicola TaxID=189291 RepID=A0A8S9Z5T0_9BILA|nr:hypothetical protein Mgra_00010238 [Meloidogyne graminicola]